MRPEFTLYVYNNPPCDVRMESTVKKEIWKKRNLPHLDIQGTGLPDGQAMLRVQVLSAESICLYDGSQNVAIRNSRFDRSFALKYILSHPAQAKVMLNGGVFSHEAVIPVRLHRLYGRITDFEGCPLPAYVLAMGEGNTAVRADAEGTYELWLPEGGLFKIFVGDESYSKETLECWLWDVSLRHDLRLDLRIGQLELYRIHAWMGESVVYIDFIPMSLARILRLVRRGMSEHEIADHPEAHPELTVEDVRVYVNGQVCPIKTFTEHLDYCFSTEGRDVSRPAYLLGVEKGPIVEAGDPVIRVEVVYRCRLEGKEIIERGEGYFLGFCGRPETKRG